MSEFTAFEHAGWARAADAYTTGFLPLTRQAIEPLLDAARVGAGTRVLDLACGPGLLSAAAAGRGARVTGSDFSEAMLAIANRLHPGLTFRQADAQALPFEDASFDAVTMAFLLGHLGDPARALREARRVLAPGGRMAAAWWQGFDRAVAFGYVFEALESEGNVDVGLPPGPPFDAFGDRAALEGALAAAGFRDVRVDEAPLVWRPASAAAAFEVFMTAGVRSTAVLQRQTKEELERVRARVVSRLERHATAEGLAIPAPVWIASGLA